MLNKNLDVFNFSNEIFLNRDKNTFFDPIRMKHIVLNKEEFIRQYIIHRLIHVLHFPKSRIQVEKGLSVNALSKRTDIVLFDFNYIPCMLIECKAYEVDINQKVLEQALVYNKEIKALYIFLSNGRQHIMIQTQPEVTQLNYFPSL